MTGTAQMSEQEKLEFRRQRLIEEACIFELLGFVSKSTSVLWTLRFLKNLWPDFQKTLGSMAEEIELGKDLHCCFDDHGDHFRHFVPRLIELGTDVGDVYGVCHVLSETILKMSENDTESSPEEIDEALDYAILALILREDRSPEVYAKMLTNYGAPHLRAVWVSVYHIGKSNGYKLAESMRASGRFDAVDVAAIRGAEDHSKERLIEVLRLLYHSKLEKALSDNK